MLYNCNGDKMNEEVKKLDEMILSLEDFMNRIYDRYNELSREVVFSAMIIKKTIDILSISKHALKESIITVQISLLRLLCDNCLAIQSVYELDLKTVMDMMNNNQKVNTVMVDDEQNMSDGYLKRKVSEKYNGFDKLYRFACEGDHFSKQALGGAFVEGKDGKLKMNMKPGNKELKEEVIMNNKSMITLCKVIIDMLKGLIK